MKQPLYSFFKSEQGEGMITTLYTLLLLMIIFFVGIDIAGYTAASWKLRNACAETLTLMKMENGLDAALQDKFRDYAAVQGLDPSQVRLTGTSKMVQRGDTVAIRATMPYVLRSLRPLNKDLRLTIDIEMYGLAQEFVR
jgi:hypothetical protein